MTESSFKSRKWLVPPARNRIATVTAEHTIGVCSSYRCYWVLVYGVATATTSDAAEARQIAAEINRRHRAEARRDV